MSVAKDLLGKNGKKKQSLVDDLLGKSQAFIESPAPYQPFGAPGSLGPNISGALQYLGNDVVGEGIMNPLSDIGRMGLSKATGQLLPQYDSLKSGATKFGYQVGSAITPGAEQGYGTDMRPIAAASNGVSAASPALTLAMLRKAVTTSQASDLSPEEWKQIQKGAEMGVRSPEAEALLPKVGKTLGQIQEESQQAAGKGLLKDFDVAVRSQDPSRLKEVIVQLLHRGMEPGSPYAPYMKPLYHTLQNIKAFAQSPAQVLSDSPVQAAPLIPTNFVQGVIR